MMRKMYADLIKLDEYKRLLGLRRGERVKWKTISAESGVHHVVLARMRHRSVSVATLHCLVEYFRSQGFAVYDTDLLTEVHPDLQLQDRVGG